MKSEVESYDETDCKWQTENMMMKSQLFVYRWKGKGVNWEKGDDDLGCDGEGVKWGNVLSNLSQPWLKYGTVAYKDTKHKTCLYW